MQSIKRTLSPVQFDGHLHDAQSQQVRPRNKIYLPGQLVAGVVRIRQDDVASAGKMWIELVGEQMTMIGDTVINPDLRPLQNMSKTFFSLQQDLSIAEPSKVLGTFAYYNFGICIPDHDTPVGGNGDQASSADAVLKPLPPSLIIQSGLTGKSRAYNRYYIQICIQLPGQLGRTLKHVIPFVLLPTDNSPIFNCLASWSSPSWAPPQQEPTPPSNWVTYRPTEVWQLSERGKDLPSVGFLKSFLHRNQEKGPIQLKPLIKITLRVPHIPSWPKNEDIPFHFTITAASKTQPDYNSPDALDISSVAVNFRLWQNIRIVAKGFVEDQPTVRYSSATANAVDGKQVEKDFSAQVRATWSSKWVYMKESDLWESTKTMVGCFRVGMLPSFVNGGLSTKYGLKAELSLPNTKSKQAFSLMQPAISSGFRRDVLPVYDEEDTIVPPAYWEIEVL